MTGLIESVEDVRGAALAAGMQEVMCVPPLHGSWSLPAVDVRCSKQSYGLSIGVYALFPDRLDGIWRWRANLSSGVPAEALSALIGQANAMTPEAVS